MMSRVSATAWIVFSILFAILASAQASDASLRATIEKSFAAFTSGNVAAATQVGRQNRLISTSAE